MVKIRTLRKRDHEDYVSVHNKGYSTEDWFGVLEKAVTANDFSKHRFDATFLAEVNNRAVGLVDIRIRGKMADIENIVVLSEYRGRGIGNALLERAIEFSASRNLRQIRAEVPDQSREAIRFYAKRGFNCYTNAYLLDVKDKSMLEHARCHVYPVENTKENTRYWVPDDEHMKLVKELGVSLSTVGKFRVMTKNVKT